MKRKKEIVINIPNKYFYVLVVVILIVLVGVGVTALSPVKPNPGHLITEVAPPSGCSAGQFLRWTGSDWICDQVVSTTCTTQSATCPPKTSETHLQIVDLGYPNCEAIPAGTKYAACFNACDELVACSGDISDVCTGGTSVPFDVATYSCEIPGEGDDLVCKCVKSSSSSYTEEVPIIN